METKRFHAIDSLRGVAALLVVLFHTREGGHIDNFLALLPSWVGETFSHGDLGVAIFFVLSGFVIAHSLRSETAGWNSTWRFILRRSIRLDPPYWVAILVAFGFATLAAYVVPEKLRDSFNVGQFAAHLFYAQDLLGFKNINPVFWTLCLEVQFYIAYSLTLIAGGYTPQTGMVSRRMFMVMAAVFAASLYWVSGVVIWPGLFAELFHCFLLGVGSYWAWREEKLRPWFLAYLILVTVGSIWFGDKLSMASSATAALIALLAFTGNIEATAKWRFLQFAGLISYSLYLIHNPITGAAFNVGYRLTGRSATLEAFWLFAVIAICLVAAYAMWWLIERPSMKISRQLFRHPVAVTLTPPATHPT